MLRSRGGDGGSPSTQTGESRMRGEEEPYVRFDAFSGEGRSWELHRPLSVVEGWQPSEVPVVLEQVEEAVAKGAFAGGYLAYEAAPGLDPHLTTRPPRPDLPLAWFGIFAERREIFPLRHPAPHPAPHPWRPSLDEAGFARRIEAIRRLIAAGDTYQVNFTFPLHSTTEAEALDLYLALGHAQRSDFCAFLRLPSVDILSASPELFFRWSAGALELRPMKGTRPRGRWAAEDRVLAAELRESEKEQAENLMIVDLLRNDAGRVAEFGSVTVDRLFEVETYPTVHQLTSTVRARTREGTRLADLFRALFPSGSVTGAPKRRTMEIIASLEGAPRGVYTGAIGMVTPEEAVFNVPIRTLLLARDGSVEMSVGSGVTWDSTAGSEYAECLQKATFAQRDPVRFSLLETMLFEPGEGFRLLDRHLGRMGESAAYFRFPFSRAEAQRAAELAVASVDSARRVRLLLSDSGVLSVETIPLNPLPDPLRARISERPVDSAYPLLFHKTTERRVYEERLQERPGFDEAVLVNERGEVTEFANGNLIAIIDGVAWTPPLECGLLPGVMREVMLERGELRERILRPADLRRADAIERINSVRGRSRVVLE